MSENKLYYIMDLSGNYYKISENGQLCIVISGETAQIFSSDEVMKHVGIGKKSQFYKVIQVNDDGKKENIVEEEIAVRRLDEKYRNMRRDWQEYLQEYCQINEEMEGYRTQLQGEMSLVDKKICDLLHVIEFNTVSDEDCFRFIDMLKDCRMRRREVKDEIRKIELVQEVMNHGDPIHFAKKNLKEMFKLEQRQYIPRQLPEIFDGYHKSGSGVKKVFDFEERALFPEKEVMVKAEVIEKMVRKETIYDGRDNDWKGFLKDQLTFYTNVEQYITNLELDIRMLDDEIEEILSLAEETHCNAAQGYKVYKMLKERRQERKQKMVEKQMLEVIANNVDCKWMADTCQYCEEQVLEIQGQKSQTPVAQELVEYENERLRVVG